MLNERTTEEGSDSFVAEMPGKSIFDDLEPDADRPFAVARAK